MDNGHPDLVTTNSGVVGETIRIEAKQTVDAWIAGATPLGVECRNLSTGQTLREALPPRQPLRLPDPRALGQPG